MSLFQVFDVAGSGLTAQSVRLNTVASNLANADAVSGSADTVYRARQPVFASMLKSARQDGAAGVRVLGVVESQAAPRSLYQPDNPMADKQGYVYMPNVKVVEEMANMISASRSFQSNIEIMNTTKQLLMKTLSIGQ